MSTHEAVQTFLYASLDIGRYAVIAVKNRIGDDFMQSFAQIPLNLAWAVTIHKSQGKTLKKARLDTGDGLWESGHAYTALSRLKNMEGLVLTHPHTRDDFKTSQVVRGFSEKIKRETPGG